MRNISLLATVLVLISSSFSDAIDINKDVSCPLTDKQRRFDILPGTGWDNLENIQMGRVLNLDYSNCQHSQEDKYLIPNQITLTPIKESKIDLQSEIVDHFTNYKSMTSRSINTEASGTYYVTLSGSFSYETSRAKEDQVKTKTTLSVTQLRYNMYSAMYQPDPELDPTFKKRILNIASLVQSDMDSIYPQYLADMIVRDYGTHVVRSVDAGAILAKTDALSDTYTKQFKEDSSKISAAASVSFTQAFSVKVGGGTSSSKSNSTEYDLNCAKTHVETYGGSVYGSNFKLSEWETTVIDNLVTIDRRGDPLNYVLTPNVLRELDTNTVQRVATLLEEAIKRYYTANTRIGCQDLTSPNFNPDANVNSNDCKSPEISFTFGGFYQYCYGTTCGSSQIVNSLTGDYSCPSGFRRVQILQGMCNCKDTARLKWFKKVHTRTCALYKTFWCAPLAATNKVSGYIFGGYYTDAKPNPVTNTKGCSEGFFPLKFGVDTSVCVALYDATLTEDNKKGAYSFGGFYSCKTGNPLADNKWGEIIGDADGFGDNTFPNRCPTGYSPNIITMEQGCHLTYCSESIKPRFGKNSPAQKPPFIKLDYSPNVTEVFQFTSGNGKEFVKDAEGSWQVAEHWFIDNQIILISVSSSVIMAVIISVLVFVILRQNLNKRITKLNNKTRDQRNVKNDVSPSNDSACATRNEINEEPCFDGKL